MKLNNAILLLIPLVISCGSTTTNKQEVSVEKMEKLDEASVLENLDGSIEGMYNDFINLAHGYFELANCRISIFKDSNEWAMVFEKCGYNFRAGTGINIEIGYFGNCLINLPFYNGESANYENVYVPNDLYDKLENKDPNIQIRGVNVKVPVDEQYYIDNDIPLELGKVHPGAVLRYLADVNSDLTRATQKELRKCIPENLKLILVIDEWQQDIYHHFDTETPPSQSPFYQMLAKVIVTGDTSLYVPSVNPNTHWRNWPDSGGL